MNILHKVDLKDGRSIMVIDEGGNKVSALIKYPDGEIIDWKVTRWNWEEKLPKLLNLTKEELNL